MAGNAGASFRFNLDEPQVNHGMFHPGQSHAPSDEIPVLFVGEPSEERMRMLEPIADLGLAIYGYDPGGWAKSAALGDCYRGEILDRDRLRATYQRARICVNVTRPQHGPREGVEGLGLVIRGALELPIVVALRCGHARTLGRFVAEQDLLAIFFNAVRRMGDRGTGLFRLPLPDFSRRLCGPARGASVKNRRVARPGFDREPRRVDVEPRVRLALRRQDRSAPLPRVRSKNRPPVCGAEQVQRRVPDPRPERPE
jgi:hypothetical protein